MKGWPVWRARLPAVRFLSQAGIVVAAWRFRGHRADYYEYLADLIGSTAGAKTLLSVFQDDAWRHAGRGARGTLSACWAERFPQTGGDLFATWYGTLPTEDLVAIQAAQYAGAGALTLTLRQLAAVVRVTDAARREFMQTSLVGFLGAVVAFASLLSIPLFTADRLAAAFSSVPAEYHGVATQRLFSLAQWLRRGWLLLLVAIGGSAVMAVWSLPNATGPVRAVFDRWGIWKLYRTVQAVRLLSLLAVLLRPRGNVGARLREALAVQRRGATPWLDHHISRMLVRIDAGMNGTDALDTGLIDADTWWYLSDMVSTAGLDEGLQRTRLRLEQHTVRKLSVQAQVLRWGLLLCSLAVVAVVALWHYRVIEELRQGLALFYAR